MLLNVK